MWEQLLSQGLQFGASYAQGAITQSRITSAQRAQLGAEFDAMAGQVTRLFDQIQAKATITQQDLQMVVAAYEQLRQVAQQYEGAVPYIGEQWSSSSYRPAYETRLQQIAARVASPVHSGGPVLTGDGASAAVPQSLMSLNFSNPLIWVLGGVLVAKMFD